MNTPPSSSARPSAQSAPSPSRAPAQPPRQQAERQALNDRFSSKLEREEGGKASQRRDTGGQIRGDDQIAEWAFIGERQNGDDDAQTDLGQRDAAIRLHGASPVGAAGDAAPASLEPEVLARMAAHIADGVTSSGLLGAAINEASIQFPAGMLAESAHLTQEPDGSIAIRIAGLDPRLSALEKGRVQIELRTALAQRRHVSALSFARAASDYPGRKPEISRVV